jgi:hypothetical protein
MSSGKDSVGFTVAACCCSSVSSLLLLRCSAALRALAVAGGLELVDHNLVMPVTL